jgi:c-di-GMP-binding flagellar brake protein YcgR
MRHGAQESVAAVDEMSMAATPPPHALYRLRKEQVAIGRPLAWPVYDRDGQLLLCAGYVIETPRQLERLSENGLYRPRMEVFKPEAVGAAGGGEGWKIATAGHHEYRFEEIDLPVGATLQLQRIGLDETRYSTQLVGYLLGATILVRVPTDDGSLVLLREGQPLVVRAFSGTDAFAFVTQVTTARYSPQPYLHLAWPAVVAGTTVRQQRRIETRLIATVSADGADGAASKAAKVVDLSAGGARLRANEKLGEAGARLSIAFRLPTASADATLALAAEVRSAEPVEGGAGFDHGVRFVDVEPLHALALCGFVASLAGARPAAIAPASR